MAKTDRRVDEQIADAPEFAQPVLRHLRALVHAGCPDAEETIKWGRPMFLYRGKIICYMAAFRQHCAFGFWGPEMRQVMKDEGMPVDEASGAVGRISELADLPPDPRILGWLRQAMALAESESPKKVARKPKSEMEMPAELLAALKRHKGAKSMFDGFSPSCRREYMEWITEAKRAETRERRVAQAVEWIAEGKTRNWKYANC